MLEPLKFYRIYISTCPFIPFLPVLVIAGGSNRLICVDGRALCGFSPLYPSPCVLSLASRCIGVMSLGAKVMSFKTDESSRSSYTERKVGSTEIT